MERYQNLHSVDPRKVVKGLHQDFAIIFYSHTCLLFQTLQKQLGARLSSKNAVVKAGRMLMKHKTGEAKALLKKKLQQLEKEWEKVCQVSVDRQDRLEDAYAKIGEFRCVVVLTFRAENKLISSHFARLSMQNWLWMDIFSKHLGGIVVYLECMPCPYY